ncbi:c-type cytochrome [Microbulbifer taiwanensis]|uniref:C-type cytochrome n=1 Tax=Microbulbifer taiwanensis TaxID=986746 RepID=A0ABW1YR18_9GAMM
MKSKLMLPIVLAAICACSPGESKHSESGGASTSVTAEKPGQVAVLEIYRRSCFSCHESGVNGAPRSGDTDAWAPRLAKGMDTLVANAINGYQAMPPRGLCFDCSEAEFAALIHYMAATQPGRQAE